MTSSPRLTGSELRCTSKTAAKALAVRLMRIGPERLDLEGENTHADDAGGMAQVAISVLFTRSRGPRGRRLVSILPQHHLMRIASNDAHFRSVCFRTSRPLTLFLTAETDSAMPCYFWGRSQPICYGYKRGELQMPQHGGSNRRCLAL